MDKDFEFVDVTHILGEFVGEFLKQGPGTLFHLLRRANLSMPQLVTLLFVRRCNMASISSISEHLNLSLGTTSQLVDRLVVGGFVERSEAHNDRRQKQVTLTAAGRALVEEIDQARVEEMARRLVELPQPVLSRLMAAMSEAVHYLRVSDPSSPAAVSDTGTATRSAHEL